MSITQKKPRIQETIRGPAKVPVTLNVNGRVYNIEVEPRHTLLDALRIDLNLTVLIEGKAVYACLTLAIECEGRRILTIEGLSDGKELDPIQQAFADEDAFQCGFCTSGQIMSLKALLDSNPEPTYDEIRRAVSGNICRCGAYPHIFKAGEAAAKVYRAGRQDKKHGEIHG
jgi:aerobic-type carbon monoxide dehydrogenase small subunit (CoxS/CutS family)